MSQEEAKLQEITVKEPPGGTPSGGTPSGGTPPGGTPPGGTPPGGTPPGGTPPGRIPPGRIPPEKKDYHEYPELLRFDFYKLPRTQWLEKTFMSKSLKLALEMYFNEHCVKIGEGQEVVFVLTGGKLNFITDGKFTFANQKSPLSPPFEPDQVVVSQDEKLGVLCIFYNKGTNSRIGHFNGKYDVKHLGNIHSKKNPCSLQATFKVTLQDIEIIDIKGLYPLTSKAKKTTIEQTIKKDCFNLKPEKNELSCLLSEVSLSL